MSVQLIMFSKLYSICFAGPDLEPIEPRAETSPEGKGGKGGGKYERSLGFELREERR